MAATKMESPTGPQKTKNVAISRQLRNKANLILKSRQNANHLCDILEMFNKEAKNYTPLLLTVEMIFTTMLRRGDMFEVMIAMKPPDQSPEAIHARWLRENYNIAFARAVTCMKRGDESSRVQAMVTCCKLAIEETNRPLESCMGQVAFRSDKLEDIFEMLLDHHVLQSALINRFQEFTEYRDMQQAGLRILTTLSCTKTPSQIFIQNFLELFDVLMKPGLPKTPRPYEFRRCAEDKYLCHKAGAGSIIFNPTYCKGYINRCWTRCLKWPLRASEANHRRALMLLVDRIMPYLSKPVYATDLLCDSLDCGPSISIIALRGLMELVTKYKIDHPDIYDRLYGMFEPEVFATRSKKRLMHLTDVFLSSTRLPEALVAAFAKRLSRLALVASPEDACDLLGLIANMVRRHPSLKKLQQWRGQPAIMPKDPYVMEETSAKASRAIHSSLWEVAALQKHFTPEVSASAGKVLAAADSNAPPPELPPSLPDHEQFDMECKKRFKTIEMNFVRVSPYYYMTMCEKMNLTWNMEYEYCPN